MNNSIPFGGGLASVRLGAQGGINSHGTAHSGGISTTGRVGWILVAAQFDLAATMANSCLKPDKANHQQRKEKYNMKSKIINYISAGYPGLYLVSHEEQRVALEMTRIAQELKYNLVFWSVVDGLVDTQKGTNNSANDPLEALIAIRDLKEKTLILLRDFHLFLQDPNPILIRQLKDVLQMAKTKSKTLIILGCRMVLPPELERELTVIEFALPGKEELGAVLGGIMESANIKTMENEPKGEGDRCCLRTDHHRS